MTSIRQEQQGSSSSALTTTPANYSTFSLIQQQEQEEATRIQMQPILYKIHHARERLKQSSRYAQAMAVQALIFEEDDDEGSSSERDEASLQEEQQRKRRMLSSYINLASTFLYMTNYYIVAPTSGAYAARLGMSKALAGIIIGMTPCAALVASILYSWWSNHTYKNALLFAAMCSILGDLLYALALPFDSVSLILLGRLLNGFGGARAINRRYIADAVSRRHRTAASAAFVTAGALGMAAGPALAVLADCVTPSLRPSSSSLVSSQWNEEEQEQQPVWWTVETAPGWIMFVLWFVFWISTYVFFEEPVRRGVQESKKKVTWKDEEEDQVEQQQRPLLVIATTRTATNGNHVESISNQQQQPLPVVATTNNDEDDKSPAPLYKNVAVMTTLGIYFVLKLVLECQLSSTAIITTLYFDWNVPTIGSFLAILGLLMFPANMVVAQASRRYQDREIMVATLFVIFVGTLGILTYPPLLSSPDSSSSSSSSSSTYTVIQYMIFSVCLFLGTNMLEGPNMSLLSKTIPKHWARGTFNSGLLATEAGTFGRVVGDLLLSAAGLVDLTQVVNLTFVPMAGLVAVTVFVTWKLFPYLVPHDDDDDDEDDEEDNDE